jgi:hypothetical protein
MAPRTSFTWVNAEDGPCITRACECLATVQIARSSNRQARVTDYQDASILTEFQMDFDAQQLFYVAQEAFDAVADAAVGGDMRRSYNLRRRVGHQRSTRQHRCSIA